MNKGLAIGSRQKVLECIDHVNACRLAVGSIFIACCQLSLLFCAFSAGISYAEPVHNLTLQEAVRIGLENSRELRIAELQQALTKVSLKETLSQVYPQITANIENRSYKSYKTYSEASPTPATLGEGYNNNLSLSLNQILWTGGKVSWAIAYANKAVKISLLKVEQAKDEAVCKITTSYWNLKKSVELKKACQKRVDYTGSIMEIASLKYKEGLIPEVELMKQEVNLACAKEGLIKASCREKVAKDNLKSLLKIEEEIVI
ncbi:MAG: TolC family protein, partial [Candidatus Desantisbacteria bacterium]